MGGSQEDRAFRVHRRQGRGDWFNVNDYAPQNWIVNIGVNMRTILALLALLSTPALARDDGQWSQQSLQVRQWFQSLMQPDNPYMSCCGESDGYEADDFIAEGDHYIAIITDGRGVIPNGTQFIVPNNKLKVDSGNPTGHGIIFIGAGGQIYCYVVPGGA
jgi:hypothetical protein